MYLIVINDYIFINININIFLYMYNLEYIDNIDYILNENII